MFSSKKNLQNLELLYKESDQLKEKFSCKDNQDLVSSANKILRNYLDRQHINTYIFGSTKTALEILKSYANILKKFSEEPEDVDPYIFAKSFKAALSDLGDPILHTQISEDLNMLLMEKRLEQQESSRQARVKQRQDFTVQCFTFIAYGIYIDIIAEMVPVSPVRVPFGAMLVAMLAGFAAQYSAGYQSQEELRQGVIEMGDRLFDNSGLHYCYRTVPVLIENVAQTLARNVNEAQNNSARTIEPARRSAQLEYKSKN